MSDSYPTPGLARQQLLQRRAHAMRFHPMPPEAVLWRYLRARQLGVIFRRQVVLGDAIVDFAALRERLIVEIDGDANHATRTAADAATVAPLLGLAIACPSQR